MFHLLTSATAALKTMKENSIVLSDAFTSLVLFQAPFVPISTSKVRVRAYSASDTFREERVTLAKNDLLPEAIVGFVMCLLESSLWWHKLMKFLRILY